MSIVKMGKIGRGEPSERRERARDAEKYADFAAFNADELFYRRRRDDGESGRTFR